MFILSLSICLAVQGRAHFSSEQGPKGVYQEGMCAHFMVGSRPRAFSLAAEVGVVIPRPRTAMTVLCSFISPDLEVTDWEEDPILPAVSCSTRSSDTPWHLQSYSDFNLKLLLTVPTRLTDNHCAHGQLCQEGPLYSYSRLAQAV